MAENEERDVVFLINLTLELFRIYVCEPPYFLDIINKCYRVL